MVNRKRSKEYMLLCSLCGLKFRCEQRESGWHTHFEEEPPADECFGVEGSPLCRYEVFQFVEHLYGECERLFNGHNLLFVHLVPAERVLEYDELHLFDPKNEKRALARKLSNSVLKKAFIAGMLDLGLNEFLDVGGIKRWVPHWHLIIATELSAEQVKRELREIYCKSDFVPRPVYVDDEVYDLKGAIRYAAKHVNDYRKTVFYRTGIKRRSVERRMEAEEYGMVERELAGRRINEFLFLQNLRRREGGLPYIVVAWEMTELGQKTVLTAEGRL